MTVTLQTSRRSTGINFPPQLAEGCEYQELLEEQEQDRKGSNIYRTVKLRGLSRAPHPRTAQWRGSSVVGKKGRTKRTRHLTPS